MRRRKGEAGSAKTAWVGAKARDGRARNRHRQRGLVGAKELQPGRQGQGIQAVSGLGWREASGQLALWTRPKLVCGQRAWREGVRPQGQEARKRPEAQVRARAFFATALPAPKRPLIPTTQRTGVRESGVFRAASNAGRGPRPGSGQGQGQGLLLFGDSRPRKRHECQPTGKEENERFQGGILWTRCWRA